MPDQLAVVLMVAAVVVLLATVVVWLRPLLSPVRSTPSEGSGTRVARSTPTVALAHGFGHLFSPLGLPRRQISLTGRLDGALTRIAGVDPYANHRRIGLALLADPLLADPPPDTERDESTEEPLPPAAAPAAPWPFWAEDERRETTDD